MDSLSPNDPLGNDYAEAIRQAAERAEATLVRMCKCGACKKHHLHHIDEQGNVARFCIDCEAQFAIPQSTVIQPRSTLKYCSRCKQEKPYSAFHGKNTIAVWCKECVKEHNKLTYDADKKRDEYLQRVYGISLEHYALMFFQQGGLCAVCGEPETQMDPYTGKVKYLAVDHNHQTNEVRELLCQACNKLLGYIEKDRERVKRLVRYLKRHDT